MPIAIGASLRGKRPFAFRTSIGLQDRTVPRKASGHGGLYKGRALVPGQGGPDSDRCFRGITIAPREGAPVANRHGSHWDDGPGS